MNTLKEFQGVNAGYVIDLYERYRRNPSSVDGATRSVFEHWTPSEDGELVPSAAATQKLVCTVNLAQAIREYGHLAATLDPLGSPPPGDPSLDPSTYGLTSEDLQRLPANLVGGPVAEGAGSAAEAIIALREVYSASIGYDFDHLRVPEERMWLRQAAESRQFSPPNDPINPSILLERLTRAEVFEQFLHRVFPGRTRFSIEGLDMLVPVLDEVIGEAAEAGIRTILLGMAHRGRLNVLAHVLNRPYTQILAEFKDPVMGHKFAVREDHLGWTGDVKYHMGARRSLDGEFVDLTISMPSNPSHLEHVNPVIEGMARAANSRVDRPGAPEIDENRSLAILVHGDASFPGEGVVAETLNLSRLAAYRTGGTVHIIANNQLGFTTLPEEGRSTLYASDLAKGFKIPIVHVNADDPEACIAVARMAFAYRLRFGKDFLIDLIGYRRYGHNEGDEPSFTQPKMYGRVRSRTTVRELWANTLIERGLLEDDEPDRLIQERMDELQKVLDSLEPEKDLPEPDLEPAPIGAARRVKTAVAGERLKRLHKALLRFPDGFTLHPKLERPVSRRRKALDDPDASNVDWALAEELAFASILEDGTAIRLTGEDAERGTFSQRHAVFHDVETEEVFIPLQAIPRAKAGFEVHNSPLTESATLAFEYGYNVQEPCRLVIWEAQYGDFVNGAQVMIDELVVSARAKWGLTPSLVMLLPHGYEGHGPDHSSARPERFLQLAAQTNIRIANCTTAAQYFHLLRRQAALLGSDPLPLIVFTPKSLLRHPLSASSFRDLAEGSWQPVIDDAQARQSPDEIKRLIFCSGKVFVDLATSDHPENAAAVAIVRLEQLYPFPIGEVLAVLEGYPRLKEVIWLQEEPQNMGAWDFVRPFLLGLTSDRWLFRYIGRPEYASPAEGSMAWHMVNQKAIIDRAFEF